MGPRARRRPRKSNTRKAAAFDAMRQYGFLDDMIESTIKELLKVYGEEGWFLIEDAAYKVLLEAILEKVVKETGEGTSDANKLAVETSTGTALELASSDGNPAAKTFSGTALELACSDVNPINTECQSGNVLDCASEANDALCTLELTDEYGKHLPPVDADVQYLCGSSSNFTTPPPHGRNSPPPSQSSPPPHSINSTAKAPPPSRDTPPPEGSNSKARRRPYYGWICSDSDDEDELVELTPGPLAVEMENYLLSFIERKRRWDLKPDM